MHRVLTLGCLLGVTLAFASLAEQDATAKSPGGKATVKNSRIRVEFDLGRGTYDAIDLRNPTRGFRDAFFQIGEWSSSQAGLTRRATIRPLVDSLGKGESLSVECRGEGRPTLLLEISLHDNESYLVLRAGIENVAGKPVRIKNLQPLAFARAFPEVREMHRAKTLNGEGGGRDTSVHNGFARLSSNNVLATFRDGAQRRSVVIGGLTYHDWMKSAGAWPTSEIPSLNAMRRRELAQRIAAAGGTLSAYLDCGSRSVAGTAAGPRLRVARGKPYDFASVFAAPCYNTVAFDAKQVEIDTTGLDPNKHYSIGFSWWDYTFDGRVQSVYLASDGNGHASVPLLEKASLPAYAMVREQLPVEKTYAVAPSLYANGKSKILFQFDSARLPGSNAVVSDVWLVEGPVDLAAKMVSSDLRIPDKTEKELYLHARADDPVGRRVDPGERYLPDDRFYVDLSTDDPFEAAEKYGLAVRTAQQAAPNPYTFPTICSWYAGVTFEPGAQNHPEKSHYGIATTSGHVAEMDFIHTTGFLNYSTVALRLVPDNYTPNNPQGWWDDRHWQEQGFYTKPYETSEKWGRAVRERGGLAITYFQSDRVSADFRQTHPEMLLSGHRTLDYTKPEVQRHMAAVYAALRGNVSGMMFDYCDEFWCFNLAPGGFYDARATAASVYRLMFQLAKTGLGPRSWIHERPVYNPGSDAAVGLIDSQRTSGDTAAISPGLIARSGLRWYKNRVLFAYDMDSKSLLDAWKQTSPGSTDRDGRRMMLTMSYVTASRLLMATSFRDLSREAIHDLSRVFPFHSEPKSARPLDAFTTAGPPTVYDFAVTPDWRQLTLLNTDGVRETTLTVALSGEQADGAMGLDPKAEYYVYDFWNDTFVGRVAGGGKLRQTLRPGEARMLSVHRVEPRPQFLSTNRHVMQGYLDMVARPQWDADNRELRGTSKIVGSEPYQVILAANGHQAVTAWTDGTEAQVESIAGHKGLLRLTIESRENADVTWTVEFTGP
ncbi:MAG TPA: hypothetical protein VJL29_15645 [Thermoguttaceae bacterium]|nr:hypothetical protein [Thermoguttaceae bacterium]